MSAALEPEKDTVLAIQLFTVRKTATDEEFGTLLSQLLGTCRMEGFRIAMQALKLILDEKVKEGVDQLDKKIIHTPKPQPRVDAPELRRGVRSGRIGDPIVHVTPMRTKEQALETYYQKHPEKRPSPEADDAVGAGEAERFRRDNLPPPAGGSTSLTPEEEELERQTRPDPPRSTAVGRIYDAPPGRGHLKINDEGKADIRRRAADARRNEGTGKLPKGWVKHLAREYDVSEALIYNIVYSDPNYRALSGP